MPPLIASGRQLDLLKNNNNDIKTRWVLKWFFVTAPRLTRPTFMQEHEGVVLTPAAAAGGQV